ncbi:MAG: glycoside hydrolase family 127 protein, partial [Lachnospiraceae bacterium]
MVEKTNHFLSLKQVTIRDPFFSPVQNTVIHTMIPYQEKVLHDEIPDIRPSHVIRNYRIAAGEIEGTYYGRVFQDSDLAKWLEAVAYSLTVQPDAELEARADEIIDLIGRVQKPDGYLDTYFIVAEPEMRWKDLGDCHEMYCAGHMTEAAVAYYEATGKTKLLDICCRLCDHIDRRFGDEEGKVPGIPGHEEIELALMRLYRVTGENRYRKLASYFIDKRGQDP